MKKPVTNLTWLRSAAHLADDVVEDPAAAGDGDERERHVDRGAQQVGDGQVAQEQVGARPHAAVAQHDDDHERVADDRRRHDHAERGGQTDAPRGRPVRRLRQRRVRRVLQRPGRCRRLVDVYH